MIVNRRFPLVEVRTFPTSSFTVCACTFQVVVLTVPTDQLIFVTATSAKSKLVANSLT